MYKRTIIFLQKKNHRYYIYRQEYKIQKWKRDIPSLTLFARFVFNALINVELQDKQNIELIVKYFVSSLTSLSK